MAECRVFSVTDLAEAELLVCLFSKDFAGGDF